MASEIKVDTIVNAGGDNDTGIDLSANDQILLKVANATKLTMNSTGQTTSVGEGGTTTSSVQQGLAKMWCRYNGAGADSSENLTSVNDSFNVASLVDNAVGKTIVNITNDMANDDYSATVSGSDGDASSTLHSLVASVYATGSVKCNAFRQTDGANDIPALNDFNFSQVVIHGDLA